MTPEPSLFAPAEPLAARMRPRTLAEFVGQDDLLGSGRPLGESIRRGDPGSCIFWGPPGTGKTTLARLIATTSESEFVPFSAVSDGVARVREIIAAARERRALGRGTILFVDEIHRFNRGQQDAFLAAVEQGVLTLVGATTENPSFALNAALLSRTQVWVLNRLDAAELGVLVDRALQSSEGLKSVVTISSTGRDLLLRVADGDARRVLNLLEAAARHVGTGGEIDESVVTGVLARRVAPHDRAGEQHYDLISALHKAVRGSDPQGALYWLARIIAGGEEPLFVARRLVRMASEDVGLADPNALIQAIAARDTYSFLGSPEGELALAQATIYLATAPKSNRVYRGWKAAQKAAAETPVAPVPLHLRNAATSLLKELGYGAGYRYDHDEPSGHAGQEYLPEELGGSVFYEPGEFGEEKLIARRLRWWAEHAGSGEEPSRE